VRGPCAWCWCILEDPYTVSARQLLENEVEQSRIMHVVACVLLAYGVHGRAKFTAIVGFGGCLDVGQQREHELWDTNDDTIRGHLCHVQLHQLHVDADLPAEVKAVVDNLKQLLQHLVHGWLVGSADGQFHHFKYGEVVDAFVVAAIGRPEDGIGDVASNQLGDGFNHTFFGANDQLIDDIKLVGFLLCLSS
jgi:hypothetical protein